MSDVDIEIKDNRRLRLREVGIETFWERMQKPVGCWLYDGAKEINGYGYVKNPLGDKPKYLTAHKLAWILKNGPVPEGMRVLHKCDVRSCANPDHLFLGTDKDNADDMRRKGRSGCNGEKNLYAKLKEWQVKEILAVKDRRRGQAKIVGAKYGVGNGIVSAIWRGDAWRHVGMNASNSAR